MEKINTIESASVEVNSQSERIVLETKKPAAWTKRFLNTIIDTIFYYIISTIIILILVALFAQSEAEAAGFGLFAYLFLFLYFVIFEAVWQRTPAKFITKTKIVRLDGTKPHVGQVIGRTFARFIPFDMLSYLNKNPIGWHDKLAGIVVVPSHYTEEDVKSLDTKQEGSSILKVIAIILVTLMVVGILAAIMLASLSTARQKALEAQQTNSQVQVTQ